MEEKINEQRIYENVIKKQSPKLNGIWLLVPICLLLCFVLLYPKENENLMQKENHTNMELPSETMETEKQEEQKNFSSNGTNSTTEDASIRTMDVKEEIELPFSTDAIPKYLKGNLNQHLYEKETFIGTRKIYTSNSKNCNWIFTFYEEEILKEEQTNQTMNTLKYRLSTTNIYIIVSFNYKGKTIELKTTNTNKEEILDFLKQIEKEETQ